MNPLKCFAVSIVFSALSTIAFSSVAQQQPPAGSWETMPGRVYPTLSEACAAIVGRIRSGVSSKAEPTGQYLPVRNSTRMYSCGYALTEANGTVTQGWAGPVVNLDQVAQRP